MAMTAKKLRDEAIDDEGVASTSMGMAKLTWGTIVRLKRGWADALDEIERLREENADWQRHTKPCAIHRPEAWEGPDECYICAANAVYDRERVLRSTVAAVRAKLDEGIALLDKCALYGPADRTREKFQEASALCDGPEGGCHE